MSDPAAPSFRSGIRPPEEPGERVLCFAFRRRELLVTSNMQIPLLQALDEAELESVRHQYLGRLDELPCYSVELAPNAGAPAGMLFQDLRSLFGRLTESVHAVAGCAVQIVEWDRTHQFCGSCGGPTRRAEHERARVCDACSLTQFPRLSPAMIVAVERDNEILLARSPHFPPGIFSVPAGFVEPGESAEQAVRREVHEETGIEVQDVRYFGSQPWPFPNSLMLGFTARFASGEIEIDETEIEEAGWFAADEMPQLFPGNISISQWLIRDFLERKRSDRG